VRDFSYYLMTDVTNCCDHIIINGGLGTCQDRKKKP